MPGGAGLDENHVHQVAVGFAAGAQGGEVLPHDLRGEAVGHADAFAPVEASPE